jgi:hypothetical protein
MPSKNNLSALKTSAKKPILEPLQTGRRKKPVEDKESELIGLKLTVNEKTKLQEKAGRVPLATYLKDFLRNQTDLLK